MDTLLLIARLILGLGLAAHGSQKLFGWFGGGGVKGTGGFMESLGYRPGAFFALGAGLGELGGGILTAIGFLGALGPALVLMVMLVAIFTVHVTKGFFTSDGGWEMASLYIAGALAFAAVGFGAYSIDVLLGFAALSTTKITWILLVAAVVLAILNLFARRSRPEPASGEGAEAR
ncbi:MAG: DoxX family protein [Candidatus Eremiobacteraeota bacterium]|nr:DoxX family protein [Candidatus Eremiobacteraeota bacterium]